MSHEVKIPSLGESINSGVLATWHVADGDTVEQDQTLYELETDKITSEGFAEVAGTISIKVEEGTEVNIGAIVATIEEGASSGGSKPAKGEEKAVAKESKASAESTNSELPASNSGSDAVSPAVRRLAKESAIDPSKVAGTGKDGRVTKGDMLKAIEYSVPKGVRSATETFRLATEGFSLSLFFFFFFESTRQKFVESTSAKRK